MADNTNPSIDDLKAPLLAALGAADLALATVNDLLGELRERAEETRTDTRSRVEESRARLTKLQEDLPEQLRDLREKFTTLTRQISVEEPITEAADIYRLGCFLLGRDKLVTRPLRLLGLGVSSLREPNGQQLALL